MRLGVIADDFTGATDIASFIAAAWRVVQLNGVPTQPLSTPADAVVISLKTRSCPATEAVALSLQGARWLREQGCDQLYFKYCSTFDSTAHGNIGPVTDALLAETGQPLAVLCPALPVNGRTVVHGYLFVFDQLLSESSLRHHPVTPMTDANLLRLMDAQSAWQTGLLPLACIRHGQAAIRQHLETLQQQGCRYVVADTLDSQDLAALAAALPASVLLTGGSGLGGAIAAHATGQRAATQPQETPPRAGRGVVLSGSCSQMTNQQVARYRQQAPALDIDRCRHDPDAYARALAEWVRDQPDATAPLLYATDAPDEVQRLRQRYPGEDIGAMIEACFARIATLLCQQGFCKFIVAGVETSSLIAQQLGVTGFDLGQTIAPGVPLVRDLQRPLWLALKSGNFGDPDFFSKAQELYHD
ncbi:3-oxo-tetronate kinase [Candidatus Sodalis endolongispinus]|uniref:3-oxo-tetronate kinase n=1 Tax=Candidatus Sodalis endolongispinus TaxID=2812662 RepID=UPI0028ACB72B|nr:3-oxo-tetronate kinase [Candidatus Sodalis endolongispinus]